MAMKATGSSDAAVEGAPRVVLIAIQTRQVPRPDLGQFEIEHSNRDAVRSSKRLN
jgi:hypothetical protein